MTVPMTRPSARPVLPEFTGRTSAGHHTLDPRAKLLEERIVLLGTPIDDRAANDVTARRMHLKHTDPDRDITLYVNSPGDSFSAMSAVHDTLRHLTCDVETVRRGRAGSPAAVLLAAGTPGKRSALPGARVVLRRQALPEPVGCRTNDLAARAGERARTRSRLEEMPLPHTGRDPWQVRADLQRDLILDARGAVEYGLADRVVPGRGVTGGAPDAG